MSTATQTLSPREQYARIRAGKAATEKLFNFQAPSGMLFKLRAPDMQTFVSSGVLPLALADKLAKGEASGSMAETIEDLSPKEQAQLVRFSAKLVRYVCVVPRISDDPAGEDEIGPEDLLREDFDAIVTWAAAGGGEAEGLSNFPGQRQRGPGDGAGVSGFRQPAKRKARSKK